MIVSSAGLVGNIRNNRILSRKGGEAVETESRSHLTLFAMKNLLCLLQLFSIAHILFIFDNSN